MDQDHNPGQPIDSDQETVSVFDFDMLPSDEEYIPNYIEGGSSNYEDFYTDITDTSSLDSDGEIDVWMSADRHIDRTVGNETEPIDVDDEEECEDPMHLAEDEEFEDEDEVDEDDEDYDGEDEMSIDLAVSTSSDSDGESYDTDVTSDEDAAAQPEPDDQPPQVFIKPPVYFSPKFTIHLPEECVVLLLTGTSADQEPPRSFKVSRRLSNLVRRNSRLPYLVGLLKRVCDAPTKRVPPPPCGSCLVMTGEQKTFILLFI